MRLNKHYDFGREHYALLVDPLFNRMYKHTHTHTYIYIYIYI